MDAAAQEWWDNYQRELSQKRTEARDEGRLEGRVDGARRVLLRLLRAKFGPLPESTMSRINSAALTDIEVWSERILEAAALRDVLGSDA